MNRFVTIIGIIVSLAAFVAANLTQYPKIASTAALVGAIAAALGKALFPETPKQ
jgi:hypothetical protein